MFTEDLTAFFNPDTPGFAPGLLDGVDVEGIFDNAYFDQDMAGSGSTPRYTLPSSAVPANVVGMALVVGGTTYKVAEPMPNGTGVTALRLRT